MSTSPSRIVSLVPSLTELIFWLERGEAMVGRTRFCVEPREAARLAIVGGTKNPRVERIVGLRPELVVANKEENRREDIEALRAAGLEVLLTDPNTVDEALEMVRDLGDVLDARERAEQLVRETRAALEEAGRLTRKPRVFVAVWWNPLMGLGAQSFGHDLIERAGAVNVLREQSRYPEVSAEDVARLGPELILLPDEPFPFTAAHAAEFEGIAPARVIDGKLLWWYGPRMPDAIRRLGQMFAEEAAPRL